MHSYLLSLIFFGSFSISGFASGPTFNRPYVQSGCEGVFYARCIPASEKGSSGFTKIYKVQSDKDELVDHYEWFTAGRLLLGWSPVVGKVAVMAIDQDLQEDPTTPDQQNEFSFYIGGKLLRRWTTSDLVSLGASTESSKHRGNRAVYHVLDCRQQPGTNEYMFVIDMGGKEVAFDILTGDIFKK